MGKNRIYQIQNFANWELQVFAEIQGHLLGGGFVLGPTDTVWGLFQSPVDYDSYLKFFHFKKRETSKPLILFLPNLEVFQSLMSLSKRAIEILKNHWNSKMTLIFPLDSQSPLKKFHLESIGIRIPDCPFWKEQMLQLQKNNRLLFCSSANISGQPVIKSALEAERVFGELCPPVLEIIETNEVIESNSLSINNPMTHSKIGEIQGAPSTLINLSPIPTLLRGDISPEILEKLCKIYAKQ